MVTKEGLNLILDWSDQLSTSILSSRYNSQRFRDLPWSQSFWADVGLMILVPVFLCVLTRASSDIGIFWGTIVGSSKSPIAAASAQVVFGLLAAVVLATIKQLMGSTETYALIRSLKAAKDLKDEQIKQFDIELGRHMVVRLAFAILTLYIAVHFVASCRIGIDEGQAVVSRYEEGREHAPSTAKLESAP